MVPCRHLLCNPDYVTRWSDRFSPIWKFLHTEHGLEPIMDLISQECNPKTKIVSSDTHISLHPHAAENQLTSPVPFSRTNTENQRESLLKFPSNCLLKRQCWQCWQCWRSHLHVYFVDPAIHYFVNINRWIPPSLPCWNLFSLDIMCMSPFFRKKCPTCVTASREILMPQ